jgi:DNA polymerase elongation subunit (family B)
MSNGFYTSVAIYKNHILLRGYDSDGHAIKESIKYKPYLFTSNGKGDSEYTNIHGEKVHRVDFKTIRDAREFIKSYGRMSGINLYGMNRFVYPFIFDHYPGQIQFDQEKIRIAIIDIEVAANEDGSYCNIDAASNEITAITIKMGDLFYAFGCGEFTPSDKRVTYYQCDDEKQLLYRFLEIWKQLAPDVVTGWNIDTFDIPYIINRITSVIGEVEAKGLSPWKILNERTVKIFGKDHTVYNPVGLAVLDYLRLYKKFTFNKQESYSLNYIASIEVGEEKTDYSEYGSLQNLYKKNFQLFMEYNIRDVELVDKIDKKRQFMKLVFSLSYECKINLEDAMTSVTLWDVIIHNYLLEQKIVIPFADSSNWREFKGAFVKEPQLGLHKWVVGFDLTSLYPMLIQEFNISPETYMGQIPERMSIDELLDGGLSIHREDLLKNNLSAAANLCLYSKKKKGFMPKLMERFFELRDISKKQMMSAEVKITEIEAEMIRRGMVLGN